MAYVAMSFVVMACIVVAYVITAYVVMAYIVMTYTVMACIVMAYTIMACIVIVYSHSLYSHGIYSYGLDRHGLYSHSLHSQGQHPFFSQRHPPCPCLQMDAVTSAYLCAASITGIAGRRLACHACALRAPCICTQRMHAWVSGLIRRLFCGSGISASDDALKQENKNRNRRSRRTVFSGCV